MVKRMVEMDDTLYSDLDGVILDLFSDFKDWLKENPSAEDMNAYYQAQGSDRIRELVDSATPIYYKEIDDVYYLYGNELDEAYENAGIGDGKEYNYKQLAIYCWLEQKASEWLWSLEDKMQEFAGARQQLIELAQAIEENPTGEFDDLESDLAEGLLNDMNNGLTLSDITENDDELTPEWIDALIQGIFE